MMGEESFNSFMTVNWTSFYTTGLFHDSQLDEFLYNRYLRHDCYLYVFVEKYSFIMAKYLTLMHLDIQGGSF